MRGLKDTLKLLPGVLTASSMFCGFAGLWLVVAKKYLLAASLVIVAILFDSLDGKVARFLKASSEFGKEFDSISDVVAFGALPALLLSVMAPSSMSLAAGFVYLLGGAIRLARFNLLPTKKSFSGLPIPAAASNVAIFSLMVANHSLVGKVNAWFVMVLGILMFWLMTSNIEYPAFKGRWNYAIWLLIALVGVLLIFKMYEALFAVSMTYVLSGPALALKRAILKRTN